MNIYLPIEVKLRELEGKMLLAVVAAEREHVVIIGEKKDTLNLAKAGRLPPGIVHDKSFTPGEYKIEYFQKLKEYGHIITGQDEETGLLDESFEEFAQRRFSEETISLADKVFAWGPHDAQSLKKIYSKYEDKIVATGSPRVDLWRSEFDGFFKNNKTGTTTDVLIVSNFGFPIDENPFWNRVARLRKAGYFERDPEMEKFMYENSAYQYRLLYHFIEMIRALSGTFPDTRVLVRPHPMESVEAWKKLVGSLPNVIIERKGGISTLIRNTSLVIHNGCTSALEASVSGVPRIAYRPIPDNLEREIPNNTSIQVFSINELIKKVEDILQKKTTEGMEEAEKAAKNIINSRLSSIEGRMAAEKIVDEWETLSHEKIRQYSVSELTDLKSQIDKKTKRRELKSKSKRKLVDIRNFILGQTREKKNGNLLKTKHKFPYLNHSEINGFIEKVQLSVGRFRSVSSKPFGQNSYIVYNRDSKK